MAVPVVGKVLLDTNVFIGYLRAGLHAEWVCGRVSNTIRFLSAIVLMELPLALIPPGANGPWTAFGVRSPLERRKRDEGTTTLFIETTALF